MDKKDSATLILISPQTVARNFIAQFPEVQHNAYGYFNYDHRVVEERVDRHDAACNYHGPDDFSNEDYEGLVHHARTLINPVLAKYDMRVACEDALSLSIRSFQNGMFDNKINANKYQVLLNGLIQNIKVAKESKEPKEIKPKVLKELGLKHHEVPSRRPAQKGPKIYRTRGKVLIEHNATVPKGGSQMKDPKVYTERLDKIAEEVEKICPELALQIDKVADVLEGRRDASTLKFDADEARYMANRFNNQVRQRDADEPYMDTYNDNDYEQVMKIKKNPNPIKTGMPYQKIEQPAEMAPSPEMNKPTFNEGQK